MCVCVCLLKSWKVIVESAVVAKRGNAGCECVVFFWRSVSYKTLGQHPGATSHPIRAFKLVNIVYHTTRLTPSNAQAKEM